MPTDITPNRQRLPMLSAVTLEDRTRPGVGMRSLTRSRFLPWQAWAEQVGQAPVIEPQPIQRSGAASQRRRRFEPARIRRSICFPTAVA